MRYATAMLLIPLTLGATVTGLAKTDDPMTIAQTSNGAWSDIYANGNAEALAANYAEDAIVVVPGDASLYGRDAIRDYWTARMADGQEVFVRVEAANLNGDALYQSGIWSAQVTNRAGDTALSGGNFVRVLDRQQDGSWKIRLETWN